MTPEICPNCGADVPPRSKSCPECGSDEKTGWSDEADVGGIDLPEEHFDYDEFVQREFGAKRPIPRGIHWFWWVVAVGVILGFLSWVMPG